jgi:hypothetical protein
MRTVSFIAAALLLALPAAGEESSAVAGAMREALEAEAPLPRVPPRLPESGEQGSARPPATKGADASERRAQASADSAKDQEANRSAQGAAASAAKSANSDGRAAAAQARTTGARGNGNGHGHGPPPHP